jgi:hypothetical protein
MRPSQRNLCPGGSFNTPAIIITREPNNRINKSNCGTSQQGEQRQHLNPRPRDLSLEALRRPMAWISLGLLFSTPKKGSNTKIADAVIFQ